MSNNNQTINDKPKSEWALICEFLWSRFKFPSKSVAFVLYFFTVIILVGLASSFIGVFNTINFSSDFDFNSISLTLIGYSLVLLCSSAIEFIFIGFKEDESKYQQLKNSISMIGVASIIVGIVLSLVAYYVNINWIKVVISLLMTLSVWFMWWVSNSRTLSVLSDYPPKLTNVTGGNPNVPLQGQIPTQYTAS